MVLPFCVHICCNALQLHPNDDCVTLLFAIAILHRVNMTRLGLLLTYVLYSVFTAIMPHDLLFSFPLISIKTMHTYTLLSAKHKTRKITVTKMFDVLSKTKSNKWQNIGINDHILCHHCNSVHAAARKQQKLSPMVSFKHKRSSM